MKLIDKLIKACIFTKLDLQQEYKNVRIREGYQ